jgi:hypothetical protein
MRRVSLEAHLQSLGSLQFHLYYLGSARIGLASRTCDDEKTEGRRKTDDACVTTITSNSELKLAYPSPLPICLFDIAVDVIPEPL